MKFLRFEFIANDIICITYLNLMILNQLKINLRSNNSFLLQENFYMSFRLRMIEESFFLTIEFIFFYRLSPKSILNIILILLDSCEIFLLHIMQLSRVFTV